jgi:predicted outer membrane repeat protein
LRNIILTDGYGIGDGGAIWNDGTLIVENSTIRDSESTASGGAIVSYGTLTITNSLLEGNTALNGGALYPRWTNSYTVISDSVLRDNHATDLTDGWGGAILIWDDAYLAIEGSEIYSNTAHNGGAFYNFENSFLSIDNSTLRDNYASSSGGAIYNDGAVVLEGVTLNSNHAFYGSRPPQCILVPLSANSAEFDGG